MQRPSGMILVGRIASFVTQVFTVVSHSELQLHPDERPGTTPAALHLQYSVSTTSVAQPQAIYISNTAVRIASGSTSANRSILVGNQTCELETNLSICNGLESSQAEHYLAGIGDQFSEGLQDRDWSMIVIEDAFEVPSTNGTPASMTPRQRPPCPPPALRFT